MLYLSFWDKTVPLADTTAVKKQKHTTRRIANTFFVIFFTSFIHISLTHSMNEHILSPSLSGVKAFEVFFGKKTYFCIIALQIVLFRLHKPQKR